MHVGLWQNRLALLAIFASTIAQCVVPVSAAVPSHQYARNNNGEVKHIVHDRSETYDDAIPVQPSTLTETLHEDLITFYDVPDENSGDDANTLEFVFPMNFWERAVALGSRAQQYAEHLVATAIAQHDAALGARLLRIRSAMNQLVVHANALERDLNTAAAENYESMEFISESLEDILARLFEELKKIFPPPDQAPHHKKRLKHVDIALKKAEEAIIAFGMQHGISEEAMRVHMENIRPLLEQVVVEIGDLIEEHPILAETLLGIGVFMIIPASLILRPLLGVLGVGPYGPIEGSAAAWAQRVFIGAQIKVGTWFEHLQKAGLLETIPKSIWETIKDLFQRFMQWAFHR